jgi:hypothetical protein
MRERSFQLLGLAGHRREPREACGLLALQVAELWHLDQDDHGGDSSDAANAGEDLATSGERFVGRNDRGHGLFDLPDLLLDLVQAGVELAAYDRILRDLLAVQEATHGSHPSPPCLRAASSSAGRT